MKLKSYLLIMIALVVAVSTMSAKQQSDTQLTITNAYRLSSTNLPKALNIIETMSNRHIIPNWKAEMEKGNLYFKAHLYKHAVNCYKDIPDDESLRDSIHTRLKILNFLMDSYDILGEEKNLAETAYRVIQEAKKAKQYGYVAIAQFALGKRLHDSVSVRESYAKCFEAVNTMKHSDYRYRNNELSRFYADLSLMYIRDRRFKEAMHMSIEQEKSIRHSYWHTFANSKELALYRLYSIRTWIFTEIGRIDEADKYYALGKKLGVKDVTVEHYMQTYMQHRKMYKELQEMFKISKQIIVDDKNEISLTMVQILSSEAQMYSEMGNYKAATQCYKRMFDVADSLRLKFSNQCLDSVSEAVSREQKMSQRNMMLTIILIVVVMLVVISVILLFYDLRERKRNRQMSAAMQRLVYYHNILSNNDSIKANTNSYNKEKEEDKYKHIFEEADNRISKEKLFLEQGFGRDELMHLMGVDKNVLATIINKYTSMNVSGYINSKRMIYAVALMKEHPEYTMNAIAEACGIKSAATFIRNFKNAFGMTPSDYRKTIDNSIAEKE